MTEMVFGASAARPHEPVLPQWWRTLDRWSLCAILMLFLIGMLLGLAASPPLAARNELAAFHYVLRQGTFGLVGLAAMLVLSLMPLRLLRRLGVAGFGLAFCALLLLPWFGTDFGKGATRWYSLGFASLQPSEFLKPCFAVAMAWLMAAAAEPGGPPGRLLSLALAITVALLLALQPDFGQAGLIIATWGVMYFVAGAPVLLLVGLAGAVLGAGAIAFSHSEHFARRIAGFLDPEIDPTDQIGFATQAIREGGIFGVGVGEGSVKWSLPDAHTDFIVAVAAEEYGLILILLVIGLFAGITVRSLLRLLRERDLFIRLAGAGLVTLFALQAIINLGVATRLLPAKGMTLPLVSYGGSSVLATGIGLGILLALTRLRPQDGIAAILRRR